MKIILLESKAWSVYAVVSNNGTHDETCELLDFLDGLTTKHRGSRNGIYQYFERFAEHGSSAFNDAICHYADKEEKIWEFIKGDIRILWFYAGHDQAIICSQGFIKSGQKTPKVEKQKAIKAKTQYLNDKKNNNIIFVETED